jgi:hypothetical protein
MFLGLLLFLNLVIPLDRVSTGSGSDLVNHGVQESLGNIAW